MEVQKLEIKPTVTILVSEYDVTIAFSKAFLSAVDAEGLGMMLARRLKEVAKDA